MIYLVGMMGCGKTEKGRAAAELLGLPFYDTDSIIEGRGRSISEIFAEEGEEGFRELEHSVLLSLSEQPFGIVSTGGGAVCREDNRRYMRSEGGVVWIYRDIEETIADIDTSNRPLLREGAERLRDLFCERREMYAELGEPFTGGGEELAELIKNKYNILMENKA